MDQFDPRDEAPDSHALTDSPENHRNGLPPPPTPSNFYKDFVQFAIFLGVVLIPVYTSFDDMAEGLQGFISEYIVPYRDGPMSEPIGYTVNKNVARTIVFVLLFAGFTVVFLIRHTFRTTPMGQNSRDHLAIVDEAILEEKNEQIRQLRQKLKNDMIILRTVHNQIYGDNRPRLNYSSVKGVYRVNANGDLEVHKEITVKADDKEGFLWTFYAAGDQYSKPLEEVADLNFSVAALDDDTSVQYITIVDEGLKKQFVIYFLPLLQPGETRSFTLYYQWPGILLKLLETGTVSYDWQNRAPTTGMPGDFSAEWIFDEALGHVECHNTGSKPAGLKLYNVDESQGSRWVFEGEQVALGNTPYELTFFAPDLPANNDREGR
ncbi:hypothetical protein [Dichotomicrobium thermohalophilum]|uniref:Uncharacterized protein n=1 Tax=Dichotomicrobium thermohalophilum TaxID=933063 RepID=A0A397Q425_9HYPH|nr:hypothetical protein [Dichotomicrobium thermohalophilum]RIA56270.1 hypothetical protein BXY53_1373 [Dichotomicrobium thermohalophilum]